MLPNNSPHKAYEAVHFVFSDLYDTAFPQREIEIKSQHLVSLDRRLQKSSKQNQKLY